MRQLVVRSRHPPKWEEADEGWSARRSPERRHRHDRRRAGNGAKAGWHPEIQHWDSPASMSIHEEATYSVVVPMMGVMNNLVVYDQHIAQNSMRRSCPISPRAGRGARTARS